MDETRYHNLIHKYFNGELNADETKEMEAWIKVSEKNKKVFEEIKSVWNKVELSEPENIPSMNSVWENIDKEITKENPQNNIIPISSESKASKSTAFYNLSTSKWWSAAAAILIIACTAYLLDLFPGTTAEQIFHAAHGEKLDVNLEDGTKIKLNSGSKLVISDDFNAEERIVELKGQAFFDVEHNGGPFIINTENASVKVVGTSFDVWARNKITKVVVKEGKVLLGNRNSKIDSTVLLTVDQSSICIDKNYPELPKKIDSETMIGWLKNKIVFDKTPIREIAPELERRFNVKIRLESVSDTLSLTGSFEESNINPVLESICLALDLSYKYEKGHFVIF